MTQRAYYRNLGRGLCGNCGSRPPRLGKRSCAPCADRQSGYMKKYRTRLWRETVAAYGGKCVCCDENEPAFLTLDHINSDGAEHRSEIFGRNVGSMFEWAYANGFPDNLQLLCWNCNCARYYRGDGICPHEMTRDGS